MVIRSSRRRRRRDQIRSVHELKRNPKGKRLETHVPISISRADRDPRKGPGVGLVEFVEDRRGQHQLGRYVIFGMGF